ncbi:MAG: hypothetical protein HYY02_10100 [Chloroflexi bacterium]|nr:hypothetical protein [Chloroflexota bacterium]
MATEYWPNSRLRTKTGLGVWEHRGKVAVAGIGFAPTMRRWDGEDLSTSVGALTIVAAQKALDDAGISKGEIDGVVACPIGMGDNWGPESVTGRPYFAPPYDTEDGLIGTSADWLVKNMGLWNAKSTFHGAACFNTAMSVGAQVVGDGLANTILVIRGMGNPPGRYHQAPDTNYSGPRQWSAPFDWRLEPLIAYGFDQYCRKYGKTHDMVAPFVLNQRRNGLLMPEGYYAQHRPETPTKEDYLAARWVVKPMCIMDMDLPIQTAVAFVVTTGERARGMKQKPVYILTHCSQRGVVRSTTETLDETEAFAANIAGMCYEGSGLTARELDVFNPYDGYTLFTQYYLEAFGWHGVKRGEALDFYAGDIRVEGPHPFSSSGGNNGNGRTRSWGQYDCIQQLRGQAGRRQVRIKAETAIAGAFTPGTSDWTVYSTSPD